jgi:hypothetical protein
MQSTHLSRSIFFPPASAQFIGHARSQTPQDTQPSLSSFNPKTDTDDAKPITMPAGHQSQNRLPLTHENISMTRKTEAKITKDISPSASKAKEVMPRPKFAMGSMSLKSGGTANIIPTAATAATR